MTAIHVLVPDDVKTKAESMAQANHMSLDDLTSMALIEKLSSMDKDPYLEARPSGLTGRNSVLLLPWFQTCLRKTTTSWNNGRFAADSPPRFGAKLLISPLPFCRIPMYS